MIEAEGLARAFAGRPAVRGVSFSVAPGEVVGLLGPNGAGKSSTMRMLAGLLEPDAGTARIAGHDIRRARAAAQARLGYLPEAPAGFDELTARELLEFCAEARGVPRAGRADMIARAGRETGLAPALGRRLGRLSKGWRQRAWFAQAVMHAPAALVLDEPTDGLDPGQKDLIRGYIRRIAGRTAVLLSTHVLEEAELLCDRLVVIAEGEVRADAALADLVDARGRLAPAFAELTAPAPA
jgi:ABC-2 type transport system ATP-binding protein